MGQREPKVRKRALRAITGRPGYALGSPESGRRPPLIFKKTVKHAGRETLAALEPMLRQLRKNSTLVERTPGSFYRKSKAYLHFHEDASGTYVDVKLNGEDFTRMRVTTSQEQARFLSLIAENSKL